MNARGWALLTEGEAAELRTELRQQLLAEAAPPCAVCETPIEWVACPTGGWWAHHPHPGDGHDAQPPGVPSRAEVLREAAERIRDGACVFDTAMTIKVAQQGPFSVIAYAQLLIADAIDPDKT